MRFALLVALCLLCAASGQAELRAGAARVSITPDPSEFSYTLGGYGDVKRMTTPATGIHDTCYARALVLDSGSVRCALVSLDLCYLPANVKAAVAARAAAAGIQPAALFLSATHTHSAPEPLLLHSGCTGDIGKMPHFNPKLLDWMAARIAESVTQAASRLAPAKAGSGQVSGIGLNRNRRGEPCTDDELTALRVDDAQGKPIAAVFNYAAHPTFFGASNLEVSGDWAGEFERKAESVLPGAVALFVNGAEGDVSPNGPDTGPPAERIQVYAGKLMEPARRLYDAIVPQSAPAVEAWTQTVDLPEQKPHPFFLLAAAMFHATGDQALALVKRMMPRKCELSLLRVGDLLLMGFPGEPTTPVGLTAKQMARERGAKHPAVVALTNGWLGYLVTAEQYRAGKYEPTMSFYGPSIGQVMLDGLKQGLARYH